MIDEKPQTLTSIMREVLLYNGIPPTLLSDCLTWAFGDDFDDKNPKSLSGRWNDRHSDIFVAEPEETLVMVLLKIIEAYKDMNRSFSLKNIPGYPDTNIIPLEPRHPKDVEYFAEYAAPVMEQIHKLHFTNINSTITFFGPMLYFFARSIGAEQVLEIGHAEGYTGFYLAHAVKDNAVRFKMAGNRYCGIDILEKPDFLAALDKWKLPAILKRMDSLDLKPDTFPIKNWDIIFQDGNHDADHIVYEFETMWPTLKGEGKGYWIAHDCYGPGEEGCNWILRAIQSGQYNAEILRIFCPYGLMLIRKMDGYDNSKRFWVDDKGFAG